MPRRRKRSLGGAILVVPAFLLTLAGGLLFLNLVVSSHFYHEFIEHAFFRHKPEPKPVASDVPRFNWQAAMRASDVRKIGRVMDGFEVTLFQQLSDRVRTMLAMTDAGERAPALAAFAERVEADRRDLLRVLQDLRAMRNDGIDGVGIEFSDIDASMARLQQVTGTLAVVSAELDTGADDVTLHGVQKQLADMREAMSGKDPAPN